MKTKLRELLTIPEFDGKVSFMKAPEGTPTNYCVITMNRDEPEYDLNGKNDLEYRLFVINVYSKDNPTLDNISKKIKDKLHDLIGETVGSFFVQSVNLYLSDFYDPNVNLYRCSIELEIYYKEVNDG